LFALAVDDDHLWDSPDDSHAVLDNDVLSGAVDDDSAR
jgi:hypothetical protein